MTQNDKELLLKDLSARVLYGVRIVIQDTFKYSIVAREKHVLDVSNFSDIFCFNYKKFDKRMKKAMRERPEDIVIKPYLYPMSHLTDEQCREIEFLAFSKRYGEIIDIYNRNHIDYRGLIGMKLAIDASDLKVYY